MCSEDISFDRLLYQAFVTRDRVGTYEIEFSNNSAIFENFTSENPPALSTQYLFINFPHRTKSNSHVRIPHENMAFRDAVCYEAQPRLQKQIVVAMVIAKSIT